MNTHTGTITPATIVYTAEAGTVMATVTPRTGQDGRRRPGLTVARDLEVAEAKLAKAASLVRTLRDLEARA